MKTTCLILFHLICCCLPLLAGNVFFDEDLHVLTMKEGLADNSVPSVYKDKDGFMWFGTDNGISRYDGKNIKNFSNTSPSMRVTGIHELSESCLAVISNTNVYVFNRYTELFIPVTLESSTGQVRFSQMLQAGNDRFWGLSGNKLILYQRKDNKDKHGDIASVTLAIEKSYIPVKEKNTSCSAICYTSDKKGIYVVTNHSQLLLVDCLSGKVTQLLNIFKKKNLIVSSIINTGDYLWIGTFADGLFRYSTSTGKLLQITYEEGRTLNKLSHTDVYQLVRMNTHSLLAVTWNGYTLINWNPEYPETLSTEVYDNTTLSNRNLETRMISAYYDSEGILWIGTNGGGVLFSDLRVRNFKQYHQERHNEICGIASDSEQYIWLATFHKGIMRSDLPFNPAQGLSFTPVNLPGMETKTVQSLIKDKEGNLWFGSMNGRLIFYNSHSRKFEIHILHVDDGTINHSSVWSLHIDKKGNIWIGTSSGLLCYDRQKNLCKRVELQNEDGKKVSSTVFAIAETATGDIWLGTSGAGLCKLHVLDGGRMTVTTGYEQRSHLAPSTIRSLLVSSDGNLYIGYESGFAILSLQKETIQNFFTTHDGLCSNYISCIVEDRNGHVWLGTKSGMTRYITRQNLFYNYYIAGSNRAGYHDGKTLFWGNNKSLTWFDPDILEPRHTDHKVQITGLVVSERPVSIGENINGEVILQKGASFTDSITLSYPNRDLSLSFDNLSYSQNRDQQKYYYRLLPVQSDWQISNGGGQASYTNLRTGEYTFEVRSIFSDGQVGKATAMKINVLPHWSHTLWFLFLVMGAVVIILVCFVRVISSWKQKKESNMRGKLEVTASEETEDEFMQYVLSVVEKNLSDVNFNVKSLAEQLNMSQPTLYRKMKQRTETTVIEIIRNVRVTKAASLILENRYSIQEISEKVGFSDTRTLRKHFMEQYGVSPSKYAGKQSTDNKQ